MVSYFGDVKIFACPCVGDRVFLMPIFEHFSLPIARDDRLGLYPNVEHDPGDEDRS